MPDRWRLLDLVNLVICAVLAWVLVGMAGYGAYKFVTEHLNSRNAARILRECVQHSATPRNCRALPPEAIHAR